MANKFTPDQPENALQRLHGAARQAGLQCLENVWRGWQAGYALLCKKGHQFSFFKHHRKVEHRDGHTTPIT